MTVLLLVRHALTPATGATLSGWTPGIHLSDEGRRQADSLATRLEPLPVDVIYSSPLERCRETAAPFARIAGLRVLRRKDLGEVGYGDWTNRPLKQLMRTNLWKVVQSNPAAMRFPGGESLLECQTRVVKAASDIIDAHTGKTVAIFSHGDPIRLLLAHFAGVHLDGFQRIVISPASVSAVALGHGVPRILAMNVTGNLTDIAGTRTPRRRKKLRG